jgi:hypothetical protein
MASSETGLQRYNPDDYSQDEIMENESQALANIPKSSKDLVKVEEKQITMYQGASQLQLTRQQMEILSQDVNPEDVEIRPDGIVYLPQVYYRKVLNQAFGPGAWALVAESFSGNNPISVIGDTVCYEGSLYVCGRFIAHAIGEQKYISSNKNTSYATATEGAKSDCIVRCCKDLGISTELWSPSFIRQWIKDYAVKVWVKNIGGGQGPASKQLWRRKDQDPIDQYPWKEQAEQDKNPQQGKQSSASSNRAAVEADKSRAEQLKRKVKFVAEIKGLCKEIGSDFIKLAKNFCEKRQLESMEDAKEESLMEMITILNKKKSEMGDKLPKQTEPAAETTDEETTENELTSTDETAEESK